MGCSRTHAHTHTDMHLKATSPGLPVFTSRGPHCDSLSFSFPFLKAAYLSKHVSAGALKGWHELVLEGSSEAVLQGASQGLLQLTAQAGLQGSCQLWACQLLRQALSQSRLDRAAHRLLQVMGHRGHLLTRPTSGTG